MASNLTPGEQKLLEEIAEKIRDLREFLNKYELPQDTARLDGWFYFLNVTKVTLGNFNNDVSYVATLLAKLYLKKRFSGLEFDASSKSQSSPGLDIDVRTPVHGELLNWLQFGEFLVSCQDSGSARSRDPFHPSHL